MVKKVLSLSRRVMSHHSPTRTRGGPTPDEGAIPDATVLRREKSRSVTVGVVTIDADGGRWGIGRYLRQLMHEFARHGMEWRFDVFTAPSDASVFVPKSRAIRRIHTAHFWKYPWLNLLWFQLRLPWLCWRRRLDVLFLPGANRRIPLWAPCPIVGTVHDLAVKHLPHKYTPLHKLYYNRVMPPSISRLAFVITPSEHTKRDVLSFCTVPEENIRVIPHGVDRTVYYPRDPRECRVRLTRTLGLSEPYILYVSRIEHPGKNHLCLIRAFERIKQTTPIPHHLVLVGSERERSSKVLSYARTSPVSEAIRFTGFVSEETLTDLYGGADLFVHPSLFEGFGLPVLEAMSCRIPVACAGNASLPEVVGTAAVFFDPTDEKQMASVVARLLLDSGRRCRLAQAGLERSHRFSWSETAARTLEVLRDVAAQGPFADGRGPA